MALETLFKIEEKFRNLKFVTQIRRDPELGREQLYLVDEINTGQDGNLSLSFLQALGDSTKDQISYFTFLKYQIEETVSGDSRSCCAVDERERLLYVVYGIAKHVIFVKFFHLHYEAADKFGYRRVLVHQGGRTLIRNQNVCHNPPTFPMFPIGSKIMSLSICPATGRLVAGYMAAGMNFSISDAPYRVAIFPVELIYNQEQQMYQIKVVIDCLPFMTPLQGYRLELRSPLFSRSNHLLLWLGVHPDELNLPFIEADVRSTFEPTPDDEYILLKPFIPGHPVDGHLNEMKIDPVRLVKSFLPKSVFDNFLSQIPNTVPQHVFFGAHLQLLGHVNKYVVFSFHQNYILATKWPKEWYKLSKIPPVGVSKVMRLDKEKKKWGEIDAAFLYGTDLFLKSLLGDAQVVRRMALGHKFKDYRRCGCCGKEEMGKKKNNDGKRISKFKVCRMCKELNFHLFYSDRSLTCHYCSNECQRKDWKQHKIIHNKEAKERK